MLSLFSAVNSNVTCFLIQAPAGLTGHPQMLMLKLGYHESFSWNMN
jgi:hypothetical protein